MDGQRGAERSPSLAHDVLRFAKLNTALATLAVVSILSKGNDDKPAYEKEELPEGQADYDEEHGKRLAKAAEDIKKGKKPS